MRCAVVKVVALGIPDRSVFVKKPAGHLPQLVFIAAPDGERREARTVVLVDAEREIAAARRPIVLLDGAFAGMRNLLQLLVGQRDYPQLAVLVAKGDLLPIGRPFRGVSKGLAVGGELFRFGRAILRHQPDLFFATGVGKEGNLRAVGRPHRRFIVRAWAVGQVARRSLFHGRGEDVAACAEQHPLAFRA